MRDNLYSDLTSQMSAHCSLPIISTNGYYGYQPVRNQPEIKAEDYQDQMEVDSNGFSDKMDNNFQAFSRKRQNTGPIEVQIFKKRRQNDCIHAFTQNKENVAHMESITEEELLVHIHGSSMHHWKRESDL